MSTLRRLSPVPWLKARPFAADAMLAALLAAVSLGTVRWWEPEDVNVELRNPNALAVLLVLLATLPLAWRRQRPTAVLAVVGLASVAYEVLGFPGGEGGIGVVVALYTVAAHASRGDSLRAAAVTAVAVLVVLFTSRFSVSPADFVGNYLIFATAWILGDNLRNRRAYVAGLEERAARLEREQEEEARRAVESERARIARELHDVVAHSMSVMVVQAGGARRVLERQPDQAREALCNIEDTGRKALHEMRRLLGVLRQDDEAAAHEPQPGVAAVGALVRQVREAGLAVKLVVEDDPRPLASGVDLSAYRIVQEALTNVMKHAGPGARAEVHLCYGAGVLELWVRDDGRGASASGAADGDGVGHGLVGMRERVALFGGELRAGPRPGGGFEVRARLPLEAAAPSAPPAAAATRP